MYVIHVDRLIEGVAANQIDISEAMNEIVRKSGSGYKVFSHKKGHKALSRAYPSKKQAVKRLRQIQYFKNKG